MIWICKLLKSVVITSMFNTIFDEIRVKKSPEYLSGPYSNLPHQKKMKPIFGTHQNFQEGTLGHQNPKYPPLPQCS